MKSNIEAIQHIVCYEQKDFIEKLLHISKVMEDEGLNVDIQYGLGQGVFSALIIGRRVDEKGNDKGIRTVADNNEKPTRTKEVSKVHKKQTH